MGSSYIITKNYVEPRHTHTHTHTNVFHDNLDMQTRRSSRSTLYRGSYDDGNDDYGSGVSESASDSSVDSDSSWDSDSLSDCQQAQESDDEDDEGMFGQFTPSRMTLRSATVIRKTPKPNLSYKVERIAGMKGYLYGAFNHNNDPMTVEEWTKLMCEDTARGKEVRLVTADTIAVRPASIVGWICCNNRLDLLV